jgi:hypothetical protein
MFGGRAEEGGACPASRTEKPATGESAPPAAGEEAARAEEGGACPASRTEKPATDESAPPAAGEEAAVEPTVARSTSREEWELVEQEREPNGNAMGLEERFSQLFTSTEKRLCVALHESGAPRSEIFAAIAGTDGPDDPAGTKHCPVCNSWFRSEVQYQDHLFNLKHKLMQARQGHNTATTEGREASPERRADGEPVGKHGRPAGAAGWCSCGRTASRGGGRVHTTCCKHCPATHSGTCQRRERTRRQIEQGS